MNTNTYIFDIEAIINRVKLFLDKSSDSSLSIYFGKKENYIAQCKSRASIDWELVLGACKNADYNWLITGDIGKERKFATIDAVYGRKIEDLNEITLASRIKTEELEEKVQLQQMLINALKNQKKD